MPNIKKNLFSEPNAFKVLYLGTCFGTLYLAWGSFSALILLLFGRLGREELAFYSLIIFYLTEGIVYLFFGPYLYTKVPARRRNIIFTVCTFGYIIYLLTAMNMAKCYEDKQKELEKIDEEDYITPSICKENFLYSTILLASFIGGFFNAFIGILQGIYCIQCFRPWTRSRLTALYNSMIVISWTGSLLFTQFILPKLNGSLYDFLRVITGIIGVSSFLFLFAPIPLPPKVDGRTKDEKDDDTLEKAANIVEEIYEQEDPKLETLIQPQSRTFSEERAIIKYLKVNEQGIQSAGKDIKISQFKLRTVEMFKFLRDDIIIKVLIPTYVMDGLTAAFWTNCTLWIVRTIQAEMNSVSMYQQLDLVININITGKVLELVFVNVWGQVFDRSDKLAKKAIWIIIHLLVFFYLAMTLVGYNIQEYEIFYGVAVFFSIGDAALKVMNGPTRNEQYAPDQRRILYGFATQKSVVNIIQAFGYFISKYLIQTNPIYYILVLLPFYFWSFFNMNQRVQFRKQGAK